MKHAHDEYRAGINSQLLGAYWLDTPGRDRDHTAADCPWCRELQESEARRSPARRPAPTALTSARPATNPPRP